MARVNNLNDFLTDVASAIKTKKGSEVAIPAANFDTEILALPSQGTYEQRVLNISKNGTQTITPSEGFDAIDELELTVAVPEKQLQSKTYNFTQNTTIQLLPDTGYDGFDVVTLNIEVPGEEINNQDKEITENGVYTADEGYTGLGTVTVNVPQTGDVPVKLFETEEQIQADTTAKEGDLAIVYRSEIQNATVDSKFQVANFPETVILDSAITDYVDVRYRATDSSVMFDCWGMIDSSRFMMDCYSDSGEVRIEYTSSDGITYTRTDTAGNPVDFGTEIYYERAERWNDAIGKFIQVGGNKFDGLYEYAKGVNSSKINFANINSLVFGGDNLGDYDATATEFTTLTITQDLINLIRNNISMSDWNWGQATVWFQDENILRIAGYVVGAANCPMMAYFDENKNFLGINNSSHSTTATLNYADVNLTNMTVSTGTLSANENGVFECGLTLPNLCVISTGEFKASEVCDSSYFFTLNYTAGIKYSYNYIVYNYQLAHTQLSAIPEYVYGKEFYGQNGVEVGTLGTPNNSFVDTNAELVYKIQNAYENMEPRILTDDNKAIDRNIYFIPVKKDGTVLLDTSNVTSATWMFQGCSNITTIPQLNTSKVTNMQYMFTNCKNLTEVSLLDTSKVTDMSFMFQDCTNLTTVPQFNLASVKYISGMFSRCPNLSDESLNNILAMFVSATSYINEKTLKEAGLTSEQATRCQSLSNYEAFTSAGWTTGY